MLKQGNKLFVVVLDCIKVRGSKVVSNQLSRGREEGRGQAKFQNKKFQTEGFLENFELRSGT